ncbi:MAG TPA: ABC transporter substrate-binding protein [Devosia sp.]|nr:ABC transporter substrate-binding protein [Devosia sp.]
MLNRRTFLAGTTAAATSALFMPSILRAQEPLVFWGPGATPSIIVAQAIASGDLDAVAPGASFQAWKTPDELRAGLSSGSMPASVVPSYVAANFYNRGLGVRLLNINTNGLLYVLASDETIADIAGLKGRTIGVPFKNDMPDYVLGRLLDKAGLIAGTDLTLEYTATPAEAVQMLLAGRLNAVLTTEPAATAALARSAEAGQPLHRVIDISQAWTAVSGKAVIPQAGLALTDGLVGRFGPEGIDLLQAAMEKAVDTVLADPEAAAALVTETFGLPAPLIARALPFSNLTAGRASDIKPDLVGFFEVLAAVNPAILGGQLPDDAFYAL